MGASQPYPPTGHGGIFRRFILPQIGIIAIAGVLGIIWAASSQREREHDHLLQVVKSNAQFVTTQQLPLSPRLATHLTSVTGFKIGFIAPDKTIIHSPSWSLAEQEAAKDAFKHPGKVMTTQGIDAVVFIPPSHAALPRHQTLVVGMQARKPLFTFTGRGYLYPLLGGILLAIGSAFMIARSIVRPLYQLASTTFLSSSEKKATLPEELTRRHDEIGILANTLISQHNSLVKEQQLRRDSEKMALLGTLTTSLAHEIKNPASAIIMHARTLENQGIHPQGNIIRGEGEQIVSLVNQWLFVAKPEAPKTSITDLSSLLVQLKEKIQPFLDFHQSQLDLNIPKTLPIQCDAQRIGQVFRNLIDNAIQAMPQGGTITLTLKEHSKNTPPSVTFTITDEGPGFSDNALANWGKTFYSEREGGMGLGLALVSGVIHAHGGSVSAKNLPQGGAKISGSLPIHN